jgi:Amt family ammonium transporter
LRGLDAAEAALCNSEHRLREVLNSAPMAFISLDAEGLILDWNAEAEQLFGWPRADAVGCSLAQIVLPQPVHSVFKRDLADLLGAQDPRQFTRRVELAAVRRGGEEFPAEIRFARRQTVDDNLVDVFVKDLTALRQADHDREYAEAQLAHQALHDRLTGLPNRTLLLDRTSRALAGAKRRGSMAALLHIGIDDFERITNSLGDQAGDELLVQVARRLTDVVRASDTVAHFAEHSLSRVGDDEFAVLLEMLSSEQEAPHVAERIASTLADPFSVASERVFLKGSIGIAFSTTSVTPDALIRDAATAMHRARERSGARYELFDAETRSRLLGRVRRENELRDAIARDQLRVFYQPIVSLVDEGILGVEALMRWEHPEEGLLAPAKFMPLVEQSGLIIPFGRWVLEQAWAQLARWHETDGRQAPVSVAVNVSAQQLVDDDFVPMVAEVLAATPNDSGRLVLELTESSLIDHSDESIAVLHRLQSLGIRLALDDFGTGYSSLSCLRRLPCNYLKLDRSFVSSIDQSASDHQITAAVIEMARALTMTVIAEGVETAEQLACLRRLGCHLGQGYLFERPLPADEICRLWRDPQARLPGHGA